MLQLYRLQNNNNVSLQMLDMITNVKAEYTNLHFVIDYKCYIT